MNNKQKNESLKLGKKHLLRGPLLQLLCNKAHFSNASMLLIIAKKINRARLKSAIVNNIKANIGIRERIIIYEVFPLMPLKSDSGNSCH